MAGKNEDLEKMKEELRKEELELSILVAARNLSMNNCRKQEKKVAELRQEVLKRLM